MGDAALRRMFGRMRQTKGWEHNGRVLAEDLLVIALDGQAEFTFHDQRHPVLAGMCCTYRPTPGIKRIGRLS